MPISSETIIRVAHADVTLDMAFLRSIDHWHSQNSSKAPFKVFAGDCSRILIRKDNWVVIEGNCSNGITAPDGGVIHICGDLASRIDIDGHYEVVIAGDVSAKATIAASGFCHLFVGGDFSGELLSTGSAKIWIGSDFKGKIKTGTPSTEIHVCRDYVGNIQPHEEAALLWLTVGGFASHVSLSEIVECRYTQFNATVARSDVSPGLYPINGHLKKAIGHNSFNRWCVAQRS